MPPSRRSMGARGGAGRVDAPPVTLATGAFAMVCPRWYTTRRAIADVPAAGRVSSSCGCRPSRGAGLSNQGEALRCATHGRGTSLSQWPAAAAAKDGVSIARREPWCRVDDDATRVRAERRARELHPAPRSSYPCHEARPAPSPDRSLARVKDCLERGGSTPYRLCARMATSFSTRKSGAARREPENERAWDGSKDVRARRLRCCSRCCETSSSCFLCAGPRAASIAV